MKGWSEGRSVGTKSIHPVEHESTNIKGFSPSKTTGWSGRDAAGKSSYRIKWLTDGALRVRDEFDAGVGVAHTTVWGMPTSKVTPSNPMRRLSSKEAGLPSAMGAVRHPSSPESLFRFQMGTLRELVAAILDHGGGGLKPTAPCVQKRALQSSGG